MVTADEDPAEVVSVRLTWDHTVDAGYVYFADIGPGEAEYQEVVANPVRTGPEVVLDFDRQGRLLGVEFLGAAALPEALRVRVAGMKSQDSEGPRPSAPS